MGCSQRHRGETSTGGGIGLCGTVFIVFLVLKLVGTITWSWWWVTAPLWIPLAIVLGILAVAAVFALIGVIGERGFSFFTRRQRQEQK